MENYEQEYSLELKHYNDILDIIHNQLAVAKNGNEKSKDALLEMNRDMWETASHSADDFDSAAQLSQFYQPLANNTYAVESSAERVRLTILNMMAKQFSQAST